jgi:hypothetical protein
MNSRLRELWGKTLFLFCRHKLDGEFSEELTVHIEMAIEDNIRAGMCAEEARRMALIRLGGTDQAFEVHRDARGFIWLDSLFADIRYALRGFRASPGFTLTVVGTLALGLGALAAAFSIFNALVLRPYPVRDPYSLFAFVGWGSSKAKVNPAKAAFTWHEFQDFRRENPALAEVLGYQNGTAHVDKKSAFIQAVTGNYFTMLGGQICMGRGLLETDDASGQGVALRLTRSPEAKRRECASSAGTHEKIRSSHCGRSSDLPD